MKCLIVCTQHIEYPDKHTGELKKAIILNLVANNINSSSGKTVISPSPFIYSNVALYNTLLLGSNGDFSEYDNCLCNVEFDNRKNIVGFDFIKTDKDNPPVIWGF